MLQQIFSPRHLRIGRELIWVSVGQVLYIVGSLATLKMLTNRLGASEYGVFILALTLPTLLGGTIYAGPGQAILRFFTATLEIQQSPNIMRAAWKTMGRRTAVVVGLGILAGLIMWLTGHIEWLLLGITTLVYAVFTALSTIFDGMQNAARQRAIVAWHSNLGQWLRLLLPVVLFSMMGTSSLAAMLGFAFAALIVFASQSWQYRRYMRSKFPLPVSIDHQQVQHWVKRISSYSWPFMLFGVFVWIQAAAERWGLGIIIDTAAVGQYAALTQIGLATMAILAGYLILVGVPVLYGRAGDGLDRTRRANADRLNMVLLLIMLLVTLLGVVAAGLFHQQIFDLLVAADFHSVSALLPVAVLVGGLLGCGQIATFFILTGTESSPLIVPKSATAIVTAGGVIVGASLAGITGVIWANVIGAVFYLGVIFLIKSRRGKRVNLGRGG